MWISFYHQVGPLSQTLTADWLSKWISSFIRQLIKEIVPQESPGAQHQRQLSWKRIRLNKNVGASAAENVRDGLRLTDVLSVLLQIEKHNWNAQGQKNVSNL